jgi:hypothetical protein
MKYIRVTSKRYIGNFGSNATLEEISPETTYVLEKKGASLSAL